MPILPVVFAGGDEGTWRVRSLSALAGTPLPAVKRLEVLDQTCDAPPGATWALLGVAGHERYVERYEHEELAARSPLLGRPEATRAVLIPITKSEAWWALPQDERRTILEERSRHIAISLPYLPAVARRLHHSRDLGEPFDFLTWFEFAPADEARFDELLAMLRATDEWGLRRARSRYPPGTVGGPAEGVRPHSVVLPAAPIRRSVILPACPPRWRSGRSARGRLREVLDLRHTATSASTTHAARDHRSPTTPR